MPRRKDNSIEASEFDGSIKIENLTGRMWIVPYGYRIRRYYIAGKKRGRPTKHEQSIRRIEERCLSVREIK